MSRVEYYFAFVQIAAKITAFGTWDQNFTEELEYFMTVLITGHFEKIFSTFATNFDCLYFPDSQTTVETFELMGVNFLLEFGSVATVTSETLSVTFGFAPFFFGTFGCLRSYDKASLLLYSICL